MTEFGEKFKEATNGAYEVQVYPNALLGDQGSVTELVRSIRSTNKRWYD